jgi:hypothetical protein
MPKRMQGKLAVVIPCFKVKTTILEVIKSSEMLHSLRNLPDECRGLHIAPHVCNFLQHTFFALLAL